MSLINSVVVDIVFCFVFLVVIFMSYFFEFSFFRVVVDFFFDAGRKGNC